MTVASTRINDYKQRHPILCDDAVSLWDEEKITPIWRRERRRFHRSRIQPVISINESAVESGDYLGNPFFKHWHGEKNLCSCNDHDFSESTQQRIRNSIDRRVVNKALLLCESEIDEEVHSTFVTKVFSDGVTATQIVAPERRSPST